MKQRVFLAAAMAAVLAACSSGVKLDDVPVETRQGGMVTPGGGVPGGGGGTPGGDAQSRVQPVTVDPLAGTTAGPTNAARVIYFDYDSFVVKPEFQAQIDAHARFLKANGTRRIVIEGHTDERGGREYNLALGQRRSEAVRRVLGLLGVTDVQVEAVSFGKEKPSTSGSDEQSWSRNRRAEIAYR